MKAVIAARLAALAAWRVFQSGDRVGAIVFSDTEIREFHPHRSRRRIMEIFQSIVDMNNQLNADSAVRPDYGQLSQALHRARRLAKHDHLIVIISDFAGADDEGAKLVLQMVRNNDIVAAVVHDPMAMELGKSGRLTVTEGELQVELDLSAGKVREPVQKYARSRLQVTMDFLKKLAIPVLPVHTGEDVMGQIRYFLGHQGSQSNG